MKDDYKRRRKAERHLIRTLADGGPNVMFKPVRQESLNVDCSVVTNVCTQGNEFIVTSTDKWWVQVYIYENKNAKFPLNPDLISETSDNELVPQSQTRKSFWCALPREIDIGNYGDLSFIAPDVVACIVPGTPASLCTFYVRTGERLARVSVPGEHTWLRLSKIISSELVVGSDNGTLYFFSHDGGRNLKETARIWKAHLASVLSVLYHQGMLVSASTDWTVRLWDWKSKTRLAVLYHDQEVDDVAISDDHIVTCSRYSRVDFKKGEVRIYNNGDGFVLLKILRHTHFIGNVRIVSNKHIVCHRFGMKISYGEFDRDFLVVIDIERECVVAQLKVGCRDIQDYVVLVDGRLVVVGAEGCNGVIARFSRHVRQLICVNNKKRAFQRQVKCLLM